MHLRISLCVSLLAACTPDLSPDEERELKQLELRIADLPASPTNVVADDPRAAELGRRIFFDERMSADRSVACASCHDPAEGFSDPRPLSLGVGDREGSRHSMPITNTAFQQVWFWDGRADSLWAQPLQAIESEQEMDFTRAEVAHFVAAHYRAEYEAVFGPLPDLQAVPARARPGLAVWDAMTEHQRDDVQRVFANTGKVLEAYQRRVVCVDTRFDRWARAELELSSAERAGAARSVRNGCIDCHGGANFSDGEFHNIGLGSSSTEPDRGAADAMQRIEADVMNGAGRYSDDPLAGARRLAELAAVARPLGAFRTPSLRGVAQRRSFGHLGHEADVEAFIGDVYDDPHLHRGAVGELDPEVRGVEAEGDDVIAFLRTLDCPPPPAAILPD